MARTREYEGSDILIRYDPKLCIHAAECVNGHRRLFDRNRRPWVDPSAAPADEAAAVIERCPTGALQYERLDGGPAERPPARNELRIEPDGPVVGHGRIAVRDAEGRTVVRPLRIALCRCGASENKPFCDGSHATAGFTDAGCVPEAKLQPVSDESPSELSVRLLRDGPLLLEGRFRLRAADGTELEGGGCALCRCGGSATKPFCDGTHRRIEFRADDPRGGD